MENQAIHNHFNNDSIENEPLASYTWQIDEFSRRIQSEKDTEIHSPGFTGISRLWKMKLHTNKRERNHVGVCVTLHGQLLKDQSVMVDFSLNILSNQGIPLIRRDLRRNLNDGKGYGCLLITRGKLLERREELIPQGKLIIRCNINDITLTESESTHSKKMMELFKKGKKTDVTIVGRDDEEYHVHELFLCMYSDVFTRMFENEMFTEGNNKIIKIDENPEIIERLIEFIYTGERPIFEDVGGALALLDVAERYEIKKLKNDCLYFLDLSVSVENAVDVLIAAELYRSPELKSRVMDLIHCHLKHIIKMKSFDKIPRTLQYLWKEILNRMAE